LRALQLADVVFFCRLLILIFLIVAVSTSGPRFVDVMRDKNELYSHLDEKAFLATAKPHFSPVLSARLTNGRTFYLYETRTQQG
jgi:hypothetical protein